MTEHLVIDNLFNLCSLLSKNWIRSLQNEKLRAGSFRFGLRKLQLRLRVLFPSKMGRTGKETRGEQRTFPTELANCMSRVDYFMHDISSMSRDEWQNLLIDSRAFSHPFYFSKGKGL